MLTIQRENELDHMFFSDDDVPYSTLTKEELEYLEELQREVDYENQMMHMCETRGGAILMNPFTEALLDALEEDGLPL